jgi:predicted amidophosphoribosyltransferase
MLRNALSEDWLTTATLVPIPSSKTREDADYDDRVARILYEVGRGLETDVRELVVMTRSVAHSHLQAGRVSISELVENMQIAGELAEPEPTVMGIVDDVLTTGRHFKAVQQVLQRRFPVVPIIGVFIARRVPGKTEL